MLFRILKDFGKGCHHFLCIRETQPAIRKSVFRLFLDQIDEWGIKPLCKVHQTNMVITFKDNSSIQCIGLDAETKLKSIVGVTSVFVEEATEISAEKSEQIDLRLRGITEFYKQLIYAFNPISKSNWIHRRFFEEEYDNVTLDHSTYRDNNFLDSEYVKKLEDLINQNKSYYFVYSEGCWGSVENIIFDNYETIDRYPEKDMEDIIYGLDFGFNHGTAMVKIGKFDGDFYLDEKIYKKGFTNADLIKQIGYLRIGDAIVYCDSANPDKILELKRAGINAKKAYKAKHSVKDGIDFIKRHKLYITKRSVNLLKELSGYSWKQDKNGVVEDEPIKFNDDLIDAARYGIYTHFSKKRQFGFII